MIKQTREKTKCYYKWWEQGNKREIKRVEEIREGRNEEKEKRGEEITNWRENESIGIREFLSDTDRKDWMAALFVGHGEAGLNGCRFSEGRYLARDKSVEPPCRCIHSLVLTCCCWVPQLSRTWLGLTRFGSAWLGLAWLDLGQLCVGWLGLVHLSLP